VDLGSASIALDSVDNLLHDFGVVAGVYAGHLDSSMGVWLHSHSFISIVSHDVFEGLLLIEHLPLFIVALQPQSGRLVVEVVSNAQVVCPIPGYTVFRLLHDNVLAGSEDIASCSLVLILYFVYVHGFLFLLLVINHVVDVIDINSLRGFGLGP
jgi:hypothetical protein